MDKNKKLITQIHINIMVTKERLEAALIQFENDLKPYKEEKDAAIVKYNEAAVKLGKPFNVLIEAYNDENLTDAKGNPVKEGDILNKDNRYYKVVSRGMQQVLGRLMFNPRVECVKCSANGNVAEHARTKSIFPNELVHYSILK